MRLVPCGKTGTIVSCAFLKAQTGAVEKPELPENVVPVEIVARDDGVYGYFAFIDWPLFRQAGLEGTFLFVPYPASGRGHTPEMAIEGLRGSVQFSETSARPPLESFWITTVADKRHDRTTPLAIETAWDKYRREDGETKQNMAQELEAHPELLDLLEERR